MRKMIAFVVLVVLAMAVPASAQKRDSRQQRGNSSYRSSDYGGRDQVSVLMNQNLRMVCAGWYTPEGCMESYGGFWGQRRGGRFYGYYDNNRRHIGPRIIEGAVIGVVGGVISGIIQGRMNRQNAPSPAEQPRQSVRYASDGTPIAVGTRPGSPALVAQSQPVWKVFRNRFEGLEVRVHVVGDNPSEYTTVPAGEEVSLELPANAKIWAEVMVWKGSRQVPTQELGQRELPYHSGWVFFNLAKGEL